MEPWAKTNLSFLQVADLERFVTARQCELTWCLPTSDKEISSGNFTTVYPELGIEQIFNKHLLTRWVSILWLMSQLTMGNKMLPSAGISMHPDNGTWSLTFFISVGLTYIPWMTESSL